MKYTMLFHPLPDRGADVSSTLTLVIERDAPPVKIGDFAGGTGCLFDGFATKEFHLEVVTDQGFFGAAFRFIEGGKLTHIESCDTPLLVGGQLQLRGDQGSYQVMRLTSG